MSESGSQVTDDIGGDMHASVDAALAECVVCGAVGLPERIANHDCNDFLSSEEVTR